MIITRNLFAVKKMKGEDSMKSYVSPEILWHTFRSEDVITASPSVFGNEGSDGDNALDWWES